MPLPGVFYFFHEVEDEIFLFVLEGKSDLVFEIDGFNGGAYTLEQMEEAIATMQAAMWYARGKYGETFLREME